ncbi:MAG: substrate-binding domain-containing protein [Rhodobacteraceae bacterium]|nr:substrate-binding domain-containing protein [Paracoccaceae bacterium]
MELGGSVTITDVARHAGVTKGTVSRVLNNYTDISQGTRSKILKSVQELGYVPSATARNLKRGRQDTLGIVLPIGKSAGVDPFLAEFVDGIARELDGSDKDLLITTAHSETHMVETLERLIARRKVDGFILTRTHVDDKRVRFLLDRKFPFVLHGRTDVPGSYAWYDIENDETFSLGVKHLNELGHEAIGFVGGPRELYFAFQRKSGYRKAMRELGQDSQQWLVVDQPMTESGGYAAAEELLKRATPPTAILCSTDALAIGAMRCCKDLGLAVGEDVSVVGYDGLPVGGYTDPPLTTYSQCAHAAGGKVANMLIKVIEGANPADLQFVEPASLVRRASDGPRKKSSAQIAEIVRQTQTGNNHELK